MAAPHLERGAAAEAFAADYLAAQGLLVIGRNLRCRAGEIDLACLDGELLVIVEVRLRAGAHYGGALGSVSWRKRRRLIRATLYQWQRRAAWRNRVLRFDVLAVQEGPRGTREVSWIRDAFRAT